MVFIKVSKKFGIGQVCESTGVISKFVFNTSNEVMPRNIAMMSLVYGLEA